jgi:hypothetical protein
MPDEFNMKKITTPLLLYLLKEEMSLHRNELGQRIADGNKECRFIWESNP